MCCNPGNFIIGTKQSFTSTQHGAALSVTENPSFKMNWSWRIWLSWLINWLIFFFTGKCTVSYCCAFCTWPCQSVTPFTTNRWVSSLLARVGWSWLLCWRCFSRLPPVTHPFPSIAVLIIRIICGVLSLSVSLTWQSGRESPHIYSTQMT